MACHLNRPNNEHGYILLPVVLTLLLVGVVAYLLNIEGSMAIERTARSQQPDEARYVAEAGLSHASWLVQQSDCGGYGALVDVPFGPGSYSTVVSQASGSPVDITATGTLKSGLSAAVNYEGLTVYEPPTTLTLQPGGNELDDTWLNEWKPTWNYGADTQVGVETYWNDSFARILMRFDLSAIPGGAEVTDARLELYMNSPSDNGGSVAAHRVTADWDEGSSSGAAAPGASWTTRDGTIPWNTPGGDFDPEPVTVTDVPGGTVGWSAWDVTELVAGWHAGKYPNQGLMLRLQALGQGAYFHSSDSTSMTLRPKLTITYACECGAGGSNTLALQPGYAGKDSFVVNKFNDTNNGQLEFLSVDDDPLAANSNIALLAFDLSKIPADAIITSANFELYGFDLDTEVGGTDSSVHRILEPWDEAGVTYQTSDGTIPWSWAGNYDATAEDTVTLVKNGVGWYSWDVTELAVAWHGGSLPNYGLAVIGAAGNYSSSFHSSEHNNPDKHPRLVVSYDCQCGSGGEPGGTVELTTATSGWDADINNAQPTSNTGSAVVLRMDNDSGTVIRTLMKFDLSDFTPGTVVSSATLTLNFDEAMSSSPAQVDAYRLTASWAQPSVTWNNLNTNTPWSTPGGDFDPAPVATATVEPSDLGPVSWDVTAEVAAWIKGTQPNYGLMFDTADYADHFGFNSGEASSSEKHPKLSISYVCPCGPCYTEEEGGNLLMVVGNLSALTAADLSKKSLIESWNYSVTLIDDSDTQANFAAAMAASDIVYVSGSTSGPALLDKVTGTAIGVVNEINGKLDNFGFCSSTATFALADGFGKTDPGHYISEPFAGAPVTAISTSITMPVASGTLAPDLQLVGSVSETPALVTLDAGATRWDGGVAPARRVHIPFGSAGAGELTADGQTLLQRAFEWAGGRGTGTGTPLPSTLTLAADADTWLDSGNPGTRYGGDTLNKTGFDATFEHFRNLVRFDLSPIPAGATVTSATLRLYLDGFTGTDGDTGLYQVTGTWDEGSASWSSTGGGGVFNPTQLALTLVPKTTGWYEWSVPPGLIHEWIDAVSPNYGLLLKFEGTRKNQVRRWVSREHATAEWHPQLLIEYTEP